MDFCFLVPNYNHPQRIRALVTALSEYRLPIVIVDDGSEQLTRDILIAIAKANALVHLETLPYNQGKGAAVKHGLSIAQQMGFTHAFQIDADFQHDISVLKRYFDQARKRPKAMICGKPVFDRSIPKARLYGRKFTDMWVIIETLSRDIEDAMCGFRIYPVDASLAVINHRFIGNRMDFDTEILVRLYWRGVPLIFLPVRVFYHPDNTSNFRGLEDNVRISLMHTRLVLGMLPRIPLLLYRKWSRRHD